MLLEQARKYRHAPENSIDAMALGFEAHQRGKTLEDNPFAKPAKDSFDPSQSNTPPKNQYQSWNGA